MGLVTTKDSAEHVPGGIHSAQTTPAASCFYLHNTAGLPSCDTTCSVTSPAVAGNPSGIFTTETGDLDPQFRGTHHVAGSWSDGAGAAFGGGISCTAQFAGGAVNCGTLDGVSCTMDVSINSGVLNIKPVPGELVIWKSSTISIPADCPAVTDPQNKGSKIIPPIDPCLDGITTTGGGGTGGGGGDTPVCSPIIIDVTGEGITLTPVMFGVHFDMKGTGIKSVLAWTWPGEGAEGFLALDRNGNGTIDDGTELFGNFSPQPKSDTPNGFAALAEFDKPENGGNGDGMISAADAIFSKLLIWVDYNHDGISQPEELKHLPDWHISAIDLNYKEARRTDKNGNAFRFRAKIVSDNSGKGATGRWAWDAFLQAMRDPARDFQ